MTVLARPDDRLETFPERMGDAASLRSWLADRWAILFSHPTDFTQEQMEVDRWVSVLSRSFGERGIAPVALARAGRDPEPGWIGRLAALGQGCAAALALEPLAGPLADLATGALRALIARGGPRFAMIIDSNLRCRRALTYRMPAELPSPLELIGWAVALRRRDPVGGCPHEVGSREANGGKIERGGVFNRHRPLALPGARGQDNMLGANRNQQFGMYDRAFWHVSSPFGYAPETDF